MLLQSTVKASDIADFILRYRRKNAFKGYSKTEIMVAVDSAYRANGLGVLLRGGVISAVGLGFPKEDHVLHIHTILTTRKEDIKHLIMIYVERFDGYRITARRKGKLVKYNTPKLLRRLYGR